MKAQNRLKRFRIALFLAGISTRTFAIRHLAIGDESTLLRMLKRRGSHVSPSIQVVDDFIRQEFNKNRELLCTEDSE